MKCLLLLQRQLLLISIWLLVAATAEPSSNWNLLKESHAECFHDNSTAVSIGEMEAVSRALVDSCQHLGLQLFKTLSRFESKSDSRGLIFSPASIWSTLLITYLGSRGDTEKELRKRLRLNSFSKTSVAMAFRGIQMWHTLKGSVNNSTTSKALHSDVNKLFVSDRLKINACFREIFPEYIETKDFALKPSESLAAINEWVKNQTHSKIVNLLPSGSITAGTKVVVANAVYFKSNWAYQFDAAKTTKDKFYVSPEETIDADFMTRESVNLLYGVSDSLQVQAIELPYSSQEHSMVILLPSTEKGLDGLLRDLTAAKLEELMNSLVDDDVNLHLPKFKAEQEFELAGPLYSMGFKKVFDPRYVDLSVIFADDQDRDATALNSVLHKSYINVNEEGTEAAAATALVFARSGRPLFPTMFVANRPFLYLVKDSSNMILFMGTVRRPQAE